MDPVPPAVIAFLRERSDGGEPFPLGGGMEGRVLALGPDRVAKVWHDRPAASVRRLGGLTAALAERRLPFAVPEVLEVHEVAGRTVSIERRLSGLRLDRALADGTIDEATARAAVLGVLSALADAGPLPAARDLPVLGEETPFAGPGEPFGEALAALVRRRIASSRGLLAAAVEGFEEKARALVDLLPQVGSAARAVLHGDLVLENLLVGPDGRVTAVLDWGFLTTEGDPSFDAAVAAALFDMYGERALERELALLDALERRGLDRRALLLHRAAYSAATATLYSADGSDGHFAWCVAALNRADVTGALLG